MPLKNVAVEIRWDEFIEELTQISEESASSVDGLVINHAYNDYRGMSAEDAHEALQEEAKLLSDLAAADWDTDEAEEIIESHIEAFGPTSGLDAGVAGLVYALSAVGATPLTSCNGGVVGVESHASDVPHVLFTAPIEVLNVVLTAAKRNGVGLINNDGYAEAFTNNLRNFHALAKELIYGADNCSFEVVE